MTLIAILLGLILLAILFPNLLRALVLILVLAVSLVALGALVQ